MPSYHTARRVFQIIDHSAIFLLIAGSYTPFTHIYMMAGNDTRCLWHLVSRYYWRVLKATLSSAMKRIGVGLYIAFGWVALLFAPRVSDLERGVATLLVMGGVLYTLVALFLLSRSRSFFFIFCCTSWLYWCSAVTLQLWRLCNYYNLVLRSLCTQSQDKKPHLRSCVSLFCCKVVPCIVKCTIEI